MKLFGRRRSPDVVAADEDAALVASLRAGDESAYARLIDQYHASLLRLARVYVRDRTLAEEVVQDTWIGLFESLGRFEGRSSLKTWLYRILVNVARTRARKEHRTIPFSSAFDAGAEGDDPAVAADRFISGDHRLAGHWASPPRDWGDSPEKVALAGETRAAVIRAIEALPDNQREVISLRDIEGWSAGEVCNGLGISDTNQRVLLHRARAKVRTALESYFDERGPA